MNYRLKKGKLQDCNVTAITSKSYVHRLLIAAALGCDKISIRSNICSKDMEATIRVINALGGEIIVKNPDAADPDYLFTAECTLGCRRGADASAVLDCGESGSTARFIMPLSTIFADSVTLTGSGKLPQRPMKPLCDVLRDAGVTVKGDHLPITLSGIPRAKDYKIAGNISSQYISGLLFMLALIPGTPCLEIEGRLESAPYVDMTVDVLESFGVEFLSSCEETGRKYYVNHIPADSIRYNGTFAGRLQDGSGVIKAEGDWSNAAYIMAIAALGCGRSFDGVTINGLAPDSIQGDRRIVEILDKFGINIKAGTCYSITSGPLNSVDIECGQIPDLVPALAVIAAYTTGESIFRNVGRLRVKECDRIEAVRDLLAQVKVPVDITSENGRENMIVHGKGMNDPVHNDIRIKSFNDHRIAMAAAAVAFAEDSPVVIEDAMAVNKSYPGFYEVINMLGMDHEEV